MASHLRLTVEDARNKLTFRELLEWLQFLDMEERRHTKQEYYLAQIAAEIRRGQVKSPAQVKMNDFLISLKPKVEKKPEGSKHIWAAHLKIKLEDN